MRKNDFSKSIKKVALQKAKYQCERCWSKYNLEFHHKIPMSQGGKSSIDNCIVLCHNCHINAPQDPVLFKEFFLRFASIKEMINYYKSDNEDEALRLFSLEIGADYSDIKRKIESNFLSHGEIIKHGMKKAIKKRGHSGFNIPFGYVYKDKTLKSILNESIIVKNIYSWYLSGKSMNEIVKILNNSKIPTKKGGFWAKKTISTILKNPIYCGYHRFEKELTKGKHEPIIDLKSFKKVQNLIIKNGGKTKFYDFF